MWRLNVLYNLALAGGILVLGSLLLLARPATAQHLTGWSGASPASFSAERQSIISDLRVPYLKGNDLALWAEGSGPRTSGAASKESGSQPGALPPCTGWSLVSSPNPSADFNQLYGTSALSPKDIWAAGFYVNGDGNARTLIEHYDGAAWSVVPSPNIGDADNLFGGISAISPKDIWAVGYYFNGTHIQTLTEHWNGTAWSIVPSPNPGNANNYLNSVVAISPTDVWATGTDHVDGSYGPSLVTLTEHWNGTAWSVVSSPNPYPGSARAQLAAVMSVSPTNVWAVGWGCASYLNCGDGVTNPQSLIEHWNGATWSIISSPSPGAVAQLWSVSASQANDVWAVGAYCPSADFSDCSPLIEHYNGTAWSVVPNAFPGSVNSTYWGVLALNPLDTWAVGSFSSDGATWTNIISHWDGTSWRQLSVTSPGQFDNDLRSLTAIGSNNVWVVGDYDDGGGEQTQVQHYQGPCN